MSECECVCLEEQKIQHVKRDLRLQMGGCGHVM